MATSHSPSQVHGNRLRALTVKATRIVVSSEMRERPAADGAEPGMLTQREFAAFLQSDAARWARVVRQPGAKAD